MLQLTASYSRAFGIYQHTGLQQCKSRQEPDNRAAAAGRQMENKYHKAGVLTPALTFPAFLLPFSTECIRIGLDRKDLLNERGRPPDMGARPF
jgi:hypothetical protein